MTTQSQAHFSFMAALLVLFSAMIDPRLSFTLALLFLGAIFLYQHARSVGGISNLLRRHRKV